MSDDSLFDPRVGLCSNCRLARQQRSAKGSVFWRCTRAQDDPRYLPYPPLPVRSCSGYEENPSLR